jgi:hypothetical protein
MDQDLSSLGDSTLPRVSGHSRLSPIHQETATGHGPLASRCSLVDQSYYKIAN